MYDVSLCCLTLIFIYYLHTEHSLWNMVNYTPIFGRANSICLSLFHNLVSLLFISVFKWRFSNSLLELGWLIIFLATLLYLYHFGDMNIIFLNMISLISCLQLYAVLFWVIFLRAKNCTSKIKYKYWDICLEGRVRCYIFFFSSFLFLFHFQCVEP